MSGIKDLMEGKIPHKLTGNVAVSCTEDELARITNAAKATGASNRSEFCRIALMDSVDIVEGAFLGKAKEVDPECTQTGAELVSGAANASDGGAR